jgi:hypothetical protein
MHTEPSTHRGLRGLRVQYQNEPLTQVSPPAAVRFVVVRQTVECRRCERRSVCRAGVSIVERWSSSSRSPSTARNRSASPASGARCWATSYRRRQRVSPPGTTTTERCRPTIRVRRSPASTPQGWVRDCSSNAFRKARSSRTGCIWTSASAPGLWVMSASPHSRPNAHD